MSRILVSFIFLLLQINLFAIQSDTLSLDEVVLKSTLINQTNPAISVSEISYSENEIKPVGKSLKNSSVSFLPGSSKSNSLLI